MSRVLLLFLIQSVSLPRSLALPPAHALDLSISISGSLLSSVCMCLFLCSLTVSLFFSLRGSLYVSLSSCGVCARVPSFSRLCVQRKREIERAHARNKYHGSFVSLVCTIAFALLLAAHLLQRERVRGGAQNLIGECNTPISATRPGVLGDKVRGLFPQRSKTGEYSL